jgi:hypothetical protein
VPNKRKVSYCLVLLLGLVVHCRKPFQPKLRQLNNNYLVVGGIINTSPRSITTLYLSRTLNLTDSNTNVPELGAGVQIEGRSGVIYSLSAQSTAGTYVSDSLTLDNNDQYRVDIITSDGDSFQSDFVSPRQTAPIDSLNWSQNEDVTIYVNTHDPTDSSRYYWWEYAETWEYRAPLMAPYAVSNGLIYGRALDSQVNVCYINHLSTDLLLGTSGSLGRDVISMQPLLTIPNRDGRIYYRYSLLVSQYAMTQAAYQYWQTIKTNSQQLGTLFDPQPSQLTGNIRSLKNPGEPVVGYASAARQQQMRMFITHDQVADWTFNPAGDFACSILTISTDPGNFLIWNYNDTSYSPYYYSSMVSLVIAKNICLDCRVQGGTTTKPPFW